MARFFLFMAGAVFFAMPAHAGQQAEPPAGNSISLTPAELFEFADRARDAGDYALAESAYRALAANPDAELRTEARFRLGLMLADRQQKYREAAVEFRKILDEKPNAARVRLELARMQAALGNLGAAGRELRAAEAAGLPPEVERMVRFYANALSARKPFGGGIEVAIAPDSNVNRATRSDTVGTVIGNFDLNEDAKAHSGVGLDLRGQAYARLQIGSNDSLLARVSGSGNLYRDSQFNDIILSLQAGPEFNFGRNRLNLSAGPTWRWYGMDPYSQSWGGSASWQHPLGKRAQVRLDGGLAHTDNRRNDLQDSWTYSFSAGLDRAFTSRFGGGLQLSAIREAARDPGYSTKSGTVSAYLFREFGNTTVVSNFTYGRLEADERLFLFPRRRIEDRYSLSLAATFRGIRIGTFSPLARVRWERNKSTIEIYDFRRISAEFGITSAF